MTQWKKTAQPSSVTIHKKEPGVLDSVLNWV